MIEVTKMDGRKILLNESLIETVESNPDTVVVTTTGRKMIIKESMGEVHALIRKEK